MPRILGVLLIAAGFSYLAQSLAPLLQPSYGNIVSRFANIDSDWGTSNYLVALDHGRKGSTIRSCSIKFLVLVQREMESGRSLLASI